MTIEELLKQHDFHTKALREINQVVSNITQLSRNNITYQQASLPPYPVPPSESLSNYVEMDSDSTIASILPPDVEIPQ